MTDWVDEARAAAGPCPECGAHAALPIVYGMPDFTSYERLQGEVVFAGCCVPEDPPAYACGVCGARWGERPRRPSEPLRSVFDDLE